MPRTETEVEAIVRAMLGGEAATGPLWQAVTGDGPVETLARVPHYKPFLPVPLWGEAIAGPDKGQSRGEQEDNNEARGAQGADGKRRKARRRNTEHAERKDSFILNRFDKILSMMEMLDINRKVEDDDEEGAKKAADDAEEIVVSQNSGKPATKLKFDLDLPPDAVDESAIQAELSYPEWDYTKQLYRRDYCRVVAGKASEEGEDWTPDLETRKRIRQVRRQFEALRPKHELLRAQVDGNELDIEAVVRSRCDLKASGQGSDCVHQASRKQSRDLAVALLVDVSLSTDAWFENRRVLDVEKEALTVLAHGLSACGDDHAILTFTSRKRNWVRV
ncbi:MAG: protein norD, partial [Rhodospirillales bacterium]|nr:protein norD [Rhodospirillales bacterium]